MSTAKVNGSIKLFLVFTIVQLLLTTVCVSGRRRRAPKLQSLPPPLTEVQSSCGKTPQVQKHEAIIRQGTVVSYGQIPWQVGIFYGHNETFLCSGTLISRSHVLTAAICLLSVQSNEDLKLHLGDWDISNRSSIYEAYQTFETTAKKIIVLEDQEPMQASLNSIALIFLNDPIDFDLYPQIRPICLPDLLALQNDTNGRKEKNVENCFTSGWGYQDPSVSSMETTANLYYKPAFDKQDEAMTELSTSGTEGGQGGPGLNVTLNVTDPVAVRSLTSSQERVTNPLLILVPLVLEDQEENEGLDIVDQYPKHETRIPDYYTANMPPSIDPVLNAELDLVPYRHDDSWDLAPYTAITKDDLHHLSVEEILQPPTPNVSQFPLLHQAMFRHKEKYNSGKDINRKFNQNSMLKEQSNLNNMVLDKRNQGLEKSGSNNGTLAVNNHLLTFPSPPASPNSRSQSQTLLKGTSVILQKSCAAIPEVEKGDAKLGNACITPPIPELRALCMVDLGSPVTCKGQSQLGQKWLRRVRSIASGSRVQEIQEDRTFVESDDTRSVLLGIVTWKRPCFVDDSEPALQKYNFVAETNDFLTLLLEKLRT